MKVCHRCAVCCAQECAAVFSWSDDERESERENLARLKFREKSAGPGGLLQPPGLSAFVVAQQGSP